MDQPDFNQIASVYEAHKAKFSRYRELLLTYNARYNLTAITAEKDVLYKHFYDSLAGEALFAKSWRVCDVGAGAGFPSLPLAIVRGDLSFTLVESTGKKCEFLKTCVRELNLNNVEVVHSRAEELGKNPAYREQFHGCCARAVARLNTLVEYCLPFLRVGGRFIGYKGEAEEETVEAERAISLLGGRRAERICYELPENFGARTLVVVQKEKTTPLKYPRGNGKERGNPL